MKAREITEQKRKTGANERSGCGERREGASPQSLLVFFSLLQSRRAVHSQLARSHNYLETYIKEKFLFLNWNHRFIIKLSLMLESPLVV